MKKNYFYALFAALMFFVAGTANAQDLDFGYVDLYGKWKFSATVEFTDAATEAHKEKISGDCMAEISKDEIYDAKIVGFAGAKIQQNINALGNKNGQDMIKINNPNNPQLWDDLCLANANGDFPGGIYDPTAGELDEEGNPKGEWVVPVYGPCYYNYYKETNTITIPDFTIVTIDSKAQTATVIAKLTEVKMTLEEAAEIVFPDIAGEWDYTVAYTKSDDFVKNFKLTLVADDNAETNRVVEYKATFAFEGYEEFTLDATFDGVTLKAPFNELYLDVANKIRFGIAATATVPDNVFVKAGKFSFSYDSPTRLWQDDYIYIRQEGVDADGNPTAPLVQQLYGGLMEREDPNAAAIDWSGTYKVTVPSVFLGSETGRGYVNETSEWPTVFTFKVEWNEGFKKYLVTEFMGNNVVAMNWGGLAFEIGEGGQSASISAGYIKTIVQGESYFVLRDLNMQAAPIVMTVNADNTMTASFATAVSNKADQGFEAYYSNATIEKMEPFDFAGEYTLTATVDNAQFPASFDFEVVYDDSYPGYEWHYIANFMGNDVINLNNGGIGLIVNADGLGAEIGMNYTYLFPLEGGGYYVMCNEKGAKDTSIALTVNVDGTISATNFTVVNSNTGAIVATYSNVVITKKGSTAIENVVEENKAVKGIYDILGRKVDAITAPGLYIVDGKKVLVK